MLQYGGTYTKSRKWCFGEKILYDKEMCFWWPYKHNKSTLKYHELLQVAWYMRLLVLIVMDYHTENSDTNEYWHEWKM